MKPTLFIHMHLRTNETIILVYHHHPFPFIVEIVFLVLGSTPFYFLLFAFRGALSDSDFVWGVTLISILFAAIILHQTLIYWLDTLVLTNFRIVYIEWVLLTLRKESETELKQLQDVKTSEKGILSIIPFLDYGNVIVESAAANRTFTFNYAPDPEEIKHTIFKLKDDNPIVI